MKYNNTTLFEPIVPHDHEWIKVHYRPGSPALEQVDKGGCVDLYNYEDITLQKGDFQLIDLGVAIQLPQGYDALVLPRSSTFKRYGLLLANSVGYIDNSYCGTDDWWKAPVYATRDIYIPKGTRCFQFRLIKTQPKLWITTHDSLGKNRGGIGSTGV